MELRNFKIGVDIERALRDEELIDNYITEKLEKCKKDGELFAIFSSKSESVPRKNGKPIQLRLSDYSRFCQKHHHSLTFLDTNMFNESEERETKVIIVF